MIWIAEACPPADTGSGRGPQDTSSAIAGRSRLGSGAKVCVFRQNQQTPGKLLPEYRGRSPSKPLDQVRFYWKRVEGLSTLASICSTKQAEQPFG